MVSVKEKIKTFQSYLYVISVLFYNNRRFSNNKPEEFQHNLLVPDYILRLKEKNEVKQNSCTKTNPLQIIITANGTVNLLSKNNYHPKESCHDSLSISWFNIESRNKYLNTKAPIKYTKEGWFCVEVSLLKQLKTIQHMRNIKWLFIPFISLACNRTDERKTVDNKSAVPNQINIVTPSNPINTKQILIERSLPLVTAEVTGRQLVDFAKTLLGIPYKYASSDPMVGFDCSGFITYVFNHFNIDVPRSSVGFTNIGNEVDIPTAKEGDLILFTGTVDTIRIVGHMGIVTENIDELKFIHATSGKANAVTVSTLTDHYKRRLVKIIRVLSEK